MAKTFAELTIGQSIFSVQTDNYTFLDSTDQYGNVFGYSIFKDEKIDEISRAEDKSKIKINPHRSSYGGGSHQLLLLTEEEFHLSQVVRDKKIFFADKPQAHNIIRETVLKKIKEEQDSIQKHIDGVNNRIELMRKKYYDSLNYLDPTE